MIKDVISSMVILILIFLLLKDSKATSGVITSIANQTASTVATLQGRQSAGAYGGQ
jgi:hypothetical protein